MQDISLRIGSIHLVWWLICRHLFAPNPNDFREILREKLHQVANTATCKRVATLDSLSLSTIGTPESGEPYLLLAQINKTALSASYKKRKLPPKREYRFYPSAIAGLIVIRCRKSYSGCKNTTLFLFKQIFYCNFTEKFKTASKMTKILGIDTGTNSLGWAIVEKKAEQYCQLD